MAFVKKFTLFIAKCVEDPTFLSDPRLSFFRDYVASFGGKVPESNADAINSWWTEFNSSSIMCPMMGKPILDLLFLPNGDETKYLTYFKDESFIGSGGFGFVAKCKNKLDEQEYAVKKIPLKCTAFDKVLREVKAVSSLNHPNIVKYFQAWVEPKLSGRYCSPGGEINEFGEPVLTEEEIESPCLYLLMEYCPSSLHQFLDDSLADHSREHLLRLFGQILGAVAHIHERGFIHGDLSLGNIFLGKDTNVRVGDLGQSRKLEEGYAYLSDDYGNGLYKSPEYKKGAWVDTKADIFSLGSILGDLLHPCATAMGRFKISEELKKGNFPAEWLDEDGHTLRSLTSVNPEDRPTAGELLRDFENAFGFRL